MPLLTTDWNPGEVYGILARNKAEQAQEQQRASVMIQQVVENMQKQKALKEKTEFDQEQALRREGELARKVQTDVTRQKASDALAREKFDFQKKKYEESSGPYIPEEDTAPSPSPSSSIVEPALPAKRVERPDLPADAPPSAMLPGAAAPVDPAASPSAMLQGPPAPAAAATPAAVNSTPLPTMGDGGMPPNPPGLTDNLAPLVGKPSDWLKDLKQNLRGRPKPVADHALAQAAIEHSRAERKLDEKPILRSGATDILRFNPKSGQMEVAYKAPEKTEKPILRGGPRGQVMKYNPKTGQMDVIHDSEAKDSPATKVKATYKDADGTLYQQYADGTWDNDPTGVDLQPMVPKTGAGGANPRLEEAAARAEQKQYFDQATKLEGQIKKLPQPKWPWKEDGKLFAPDAEKGRREIQADEYDRLASKADAISEERQRKQADLTDLRAREKTAKQRLDEMRGGGAPPAATPATSPPAGPKKKRYEYRDGKLVEVE